MSTARCCEGCGSEGASAFSPHGDDRRGARARESRHHDRERTKRTPGLERCLRSSAARQDHQRVRACIVWSRCPRIAVTRSVPLNSGQSASMTKAPELVLQRLGAARRGRCPRDRCAQRSRKQRVRRQCREHHRWRAGDDKGFRGSVSLEGGPGSGLSCRHEDCVGSRRGRQPVEDVAGIEGSSLAPARSLEVHPELIFEWTVGADRKCPPRNEVALPCRKGGIRHWRRDADGVREGRQAGKARSPEKRDRNVRLDHASRRFAGRMANEASAVSIGSAAPSKRMLTGTASTPRANPGAATSGWRGGQAFHQLLQLVLQLNRKAPIHPRGPLRLQCVVHGLSSDARRPRCQSKYDPCLLSICPAYPREHHSVASVPDANKLSEATSTALLRSTCRLQREYRRLMHGTSALYDRYLRLAAEAGTLGFPPRLLKVCGRTARSR